MLVWFPLSNRMTQKPISTASYRGKDYTSYITSPLLINILVFYFMKKYNKGFTLIELLVVIAIIGILASIVLVSLNTARSKGRDASATGSMSSIRAQAEIYFDTNQNSYADMCISTGIDPEINKLLLAATAQAGTADCESEDTGGTAYVAHVDLNDGVNDFCVDSTGFAGKVDVSGTTAPDYGDFQCDADGTVN